MARMLECVRRRAQEVLLCWSCLSREAIVLFLTLCFNVWTDVELAMGFMRGGYFDVGKIGRVERWGQ